MATPFAILQVTSIGTPLDDPQWNQPSLTDLAITFSAACQTGYTGDTIPTNDPSRPEVTTGQFLMPTATVRVAPGTPPEDIADAMIAAAIPAMQENGGPTVAPENIYVPTFMIRDTS